MWHFSALVQEACKSQLKWVFKMDYTTWKTANKCIYDLRDGHYDKKPYDCVLWRNLDWTSYIVMIEHVL